MLSPVTANRCCFEEGTNPMLTVGDKFPQFGLRRP
jgi:hypothetical protein